MVDAVPLRRALVLFFDGLQRAGNRIAAAPGLEVDRRVIIVEQLFFDEVAAVRVIRHLALEVDVADLDKALELIRRRIAAVVRMELRIDGAIFLNVVVNPVRAAPTKIRARRAVDRLRPAHLRLERRAFAIALVMPHRDTVDDALDIELVRVKQGAQERVHVIDFAIRRDDRARRELCSLDHAHRGKACRHRASHDGCREFLERFLHFRPPTAQRCCAAIQSKSLTALPLMVSSQRSL